MMSFGEQFNEKLDFCYFFIHVYTVCKKYWKNYRKKNYVHNFINIFSVS